MDDIKIKTNKPNEDKEYVNELDKVNTQKKKITDVSVFDETLKEINQILIKLEQKSELDQGQAKKNDILPELKDAISKIYVAKNELTKKEDNLIKENNLLKRVEDLEKNINNTNDIKEHEIDSKILSIDELYDFKESEKKKKENPFGFYSYLIFTVVIFVTFYGILNISKDLIILKYPIFEPYINYFYEIIAILEIIFLGLYSFVENII
jgi:hypothetical protein